MAPPTHKSKKSRTAPPRARPASSSALSQPVVEDASSLTALSSFSPKGHLFASLSLSVDKHRLRVHNTTTGQSVAEHVVESAHVTALSWAQFDLAKDPLAMEEEEEEDSSPKKKRKKRNSVAQVSATDPLSNTAEVVTLGLSNGCLLVFDPSHGRVVRTLSHPSSTSSILSISTSTHQNTASIWTSGGDSSLRFWDARKGEHIVSWKNEERMPCTSMSVRCGLDTGSVDLLLAHHSIRLLSTSQNAYPVSEFAKPKERASFIGHASNVTSLQWAGSDSQPSTRFASMAEADRHVYLWDVPDDSALEGKLVAIISLDSDARQISFSPASSHPNLLVLSASGKVSVYSLASDLASATPQKKSKQKVRTLNPVSIVTISSKQTSFPIEVTGVSFVHDEEGSIRVARLVGGVRPVFDIVQYLDASGNFIPDINIVHKDAGASLISDEDNTPGAPNKRYAESSSLAVRSGNDLGQDAITDDLALRDIDGALDIDLAELSLGQRLTALEPGAAPARTNDSDSLSDNDDEEDTLSSRGRRRRPRAGSAMSSITLTRTLIQALHSSDMRLLETCLSHTDASLIVNTVRRLPPQLAVPLLTACMERLGRGKGAGAGKGGGAGAGSQRGTGLVRWIKTVLVVHSGHLMTMPDLVARLSGLHATLTTRLTLQGSLLSLSGRLDMVLQQIELRSSAAPAPLAASSQTRMGKKNENGRSGTGREPRRYVEGESSDEDGEEGGMDVEVEEGSDAGSIEDVELGGDSEAEELDSEDDDDDDDEEEEDEEDEEEDGMPRLNGFIDDEAEEDYDSEESE